MPKFEAKTTTSEAKPEAKASVAITPKTREAAFAFADRVSENTFVQETMSTFVYAKEVVQVGPLALLFSIESVMTRKEMLSVFPRLGSNQKEGSNNPEIYQYPHKNDNGETVDKDGNWYGDYVERFQIVKLARKELEGIKLAMQESDDAPAEYASEDEASLSRLKAKYQGQIDSARSNARRCGGLLHQVDDVTALGFVVKLAFKKNTDGHMEPDGTNKPVFVQDPETGKFKNLSVSSFLLYSVAKAKDKIAKGMDKYQALTTSGQKKKAAGTTTTGDGKGVANVADAQTVLQNFVAWHEHHGTALLARVNADLKARDFDLITTIFETVRELMPIYSNQRIKVALENYEIGQNEADKSEAA